MAMRHSVMLDPKRCRGCTSCIKCCPTEAIRVRGRRATILPDRCIRKILSVPSPDFFIDF